jgi:hypothetical protein
MKGLKALAIRADLKNTSAVELVISRYTKQNGRPITNNYKSKLCDCYQHYCNSIKYIGKNPSILLNQSAYSHRLKKDV